MKRKYVLAFVGFLGVAAAAAFLLVSETTERKAEAADPRTVAPLVRVAEAKQTGMAERSFTGNVGQAECGACSLIDRFLLPVEGVLRGFFAIFNGLLFRVASHERNYGEQCQ